MKKKGMDEHVSEVECDLQQAGHLCLVEEIEYGIEEDIESSGPGGTECNPLPSVVL